ncbi:hypothetical protein ABZ743_09305 [Streptomyces sp. NPDC006662]|uniref:hypothetical protein n=1 Tax=Streptomyces sp. NPDC006662 TaxID=3156902 RepID=UPI0033FEFF5C
MKLVKAALASAAIVAATLGVTAPAHAATQHCNSNGNFSLCADATWYRYVGDTYANVTLSSSHSTDYRWTITSSGGSTQTGLIYPGQTGHASFPGRVNITACVKEATLGTVCVGPFSPDTSNAG